MKRFIAVLMALVCVVSLAACDLSGAIVYDLGNTDRANYFNKVYTELVDKYGEAEFKDGNLTGVAVVRVLDFTGDGVYELYMAYADGTAPYVNRQVVYGFDFGAATLLDEEITTKSSPDKSAPCVWLYTDTAGRAYIVKGDDLSAEADYNTYIQTRGEEKIYAFEKEFTELDGIEQEGTYEKIELADITEEDVDVVFEENEKVIDSIKGQTEEK